MNILHLTDLHYSEKGKDPSKIIKAIIAKIKEENVSIDFVFFTGDIVNIGSDDAQYLKATSLLFDALRFELNLNCEFRASAREIPI